MPEISGTPHGDDKKAILVAATGSIAAMNLPAYIVALRANRMPIRVLLTRTAQEFVSFRTVSLIADECIDGGAQPWSGRGHVAMLQDVGLVVVVPATVHLLGAFASGLADTPLLATLLAADCPIMLVPNANHVMWGKPMVQRNVRQLEADGVHVVAPELEKSICVGRGVPQVAAVAAGPNQIAVLARNLLGLGSGVVDGR